MKIECVKEKLEVAISKAEKVNGKNLTLPILGCILIEAKEGNIFLRSTNLDLGLEINFPAKVTKEGKIAVPGNILSSFLSNLKEENNIIFEEKEGNLEIKAGNIKSLIKGQPAEDFPVIPKVSGGNKFEIDQEDFVRGLKSVWYSSSPSSVKPELSSVYIYTEGEEVVFVATDSFRLAEKRVKTRKKLDFEPILIPFKNVPEIIRNIEDQKKEITVEVDSNQISFSFDGNYLVSRTIEGSFPDYKQIIPKDIKTESVCLKQDLISSLKIANVFSDTYNQISFNIVPGDKKFEIKTKNSDVGENTNNLDSVLKGEDLSISFNYKYIADCFQSISSDSVELSFGGLSRPLLIRGVSDRTFLYLVMPMNK